MGRSCSQGTSTLHGQIAWFRISRSYAFLLPAPPLFSWSSIMQTLSIEYQPLGALKPRASNPRTHSDKQIDQIAHAILRFGFTNPILVGTDNLIAAGEGRWRAARKLGL